MQNVFLLHTIIYTWTLITSIRKSDIDLCVSYSRFYAMCCSHDGFLFLFVMSLCHLYLLQLCYLMRFILYLLKYCCVVKMFLNLNDCRNLLPVMPVYKFMHHSIVSNFMDHICINSNNCSSELAYSSQTYTVCLFLSFCSYIIWAVYILLFVSETM